MEVRMRGGGLVSAIVLVWLLLGVLALWQRGYFNSSDTSCNVVLDVALTVVAGPLNYAGVKPNVACPQPSSMPVFGIQPLSVGVSS
jgi:hypothetical protein